MWQQSHALLNALLGLDRSAHELAFAQMAWRTVFVFAVAILLVRAGARRFLGHGAGIDTMAIVLLGSVLSRGINGQAPFFPTLGASLLLVGLHHILMTCACRWHWCSKVLKGSAHVLVRDGRVHRPELERAKITYDDLEEHLRLNGNVSSLADVAEARLERGGKISVVHACRGAGADPSSAADLRQAVDDQVYTDREHRAERG